GRLVHNAPSSHLVLAETRLDISSHPLSRRTWSGSGKLSRLLSEPCETWSLSLRCRAGADGKEAWRAEAPAKKIEAHHRTEARPAASTPATDGKRIVSYFGSCGLLACQTPSPA